MWLALAGLYAAAAIVVHAVLSRARVSGNSVIRFAGIGVVAGCGLAVHLGLAYGPSDETWAALICFGLACELYVFLFTLTMTSVAVGLLFRLRSGCLTQSEIERVYAPSTMVRARLQRLLDNGLLREDSATGGYTLTPRAGRLLRVFDVLRAIFRPYATN
jgi:hypothetical protein